tara:strand:+ start:26 stop:247 length:222 start_codon:yes stop_codon:yes gene_type:complete
VATRSVFSENSCQKISEPNHNSYLYASAVRALVVGLPERFAMKALGHSSKVIHHAYAKNTVVEEPSLESYSKG